MTNEDLAAEISTWIRKNKHTRKDRNPVWIALKRELSKLGHWKQLPRGNPRKGYITSTRNQSTED